MIFDDLQGLRAGAFAKADGISLFGVSAVDLLFTKAYIDMCGQLLINIMNCEGPA